MNEGILVPDGQPLAWGREISRDTSGRFPLLKYATRRRLLPELLYDARRWASRPHLVQGNRVLTFAEHEAAVNAVVAHLSALGVEKGDPVLFFADNCIEWVVSFWAIAKLGAVIVLGNAWWSERELAETVARIAPRLILTDEDRLDKVPSGTERRLLSSLSSLLLDGPMRPASSLPAATEDDPAVVLFTAGTTGFPKGAILPHRAVIANLHNLLNIMGRLPGELKPDTASSTTLQTLPLFHMGGLQTIGINLLIGGKIVFLERRFNVGEVLRLIEQEQVTTWGCVPTMMSRVLEHPDLQTRSTASLRSITMGGSSVPPALTARAARAFPQAARNLHAVYGLTEAGGSVTSASGREVAAHPGTVGRLLPVVELRFKDADDEGVGEFLVRSPSNMLGYWGAADSPIDDDGFLHTGDLGYLSEDGYAYLVGRSKDIIIRGGENIASPHVEACLREHPDVLDVAVLGIPNEDLGEEVGAVTVLRPGTKLTAEQLRQFASSRLANFEVPTRWWIRTTPLPTNAVGKVLKAEVFQDWKQTAGF